MAVSLIFSTPAPLSNFRPQVVSEGGCDVSERAQKVKTLKWQRFRFASIIVNKHGHQKMFCYYFYVEYIFSIDGFHIIVPCFRKIRMPDVVALVDFLQLFQLINRLFYFFPKIYLLNGIQSRHNRQSCLYCTSKQCISIYSASS